MLEIEKQLSIMLISWLSFPKDSYILLLGNTLGYADFLHAKGCRVETAQLDDALKIYKNNFDFVFANGILEASPEPAEAMRELKSLIKPNGTIYLGTDNRLGLRYFCGEMDPYTDSVFDGIESYKYTPGSGRTGRCYARIEIERILQESGYRDPKFYSVFPGLEAAQLIFSDHYQSNEELSIRYTPLYRQSDSVFMREEKLFADIGEMGMLSGMANSYLIECTLDRHHTSVKSVSVSYDRGLEFSCATIINDDNTVMKRAVYPEGDGHIRQLAENMQDLREHNIPVVKGELQDDAYIMPYLKGKTGNVYLQELMTRDVQKFIEQVDHFRDMIMHSSEIVGEDEYGMILKRGYFDMIPLNTIYYNKEFVFIDQEFCMENYPMNAILYRAVNVIYDDVPEREKILPKTFFWERYGMKEQADYLCRYGEVFMNKLRSRERLRAFNGIHMRNDWIMDKNRRKIMTLDFDEYKKNCFHDMEGKQIILFGSGKYADKYLAFYRQDYPLLRIVDNNSEKWGTKLQGIPIEAPETIIPDREKCKVIICTRDYENVFRQLKKMNVPYIGIYDAHYIYPGRQQIRPVKRVETSEPKRYRVGYVSGVFDLFHIGHINLLRRAKEQCDYLIAAVTSDEYVRAHKKREPFIPFEERLEVVKTCRYVDEAAGVPFQYSGTVEAFEKYHFDCQFVGSDCANDPWWLEQKEWLEQHGSTITFFPYTEQTSSTKIKALIDKNLA